MIQFLRRILVVIFMLVLILFVKSININFDSTEIWQTILAIGFLIITSYSLGEICYQLRFPRFIGYFIVGLLFGINSKFLFGFDTFTIVNFKIADRLAFSNAFALGMIGLIAGLEIDFGELKKTWKSISIVLSIQLIIMFLIVSSAVWIVWQIFFPTSVFHFNQLLFTAIIISLFSLNTSIEQNIGIQKEVGVKNSYSDFITNSTIIKNIFILILISISLITFGQFAVHPENVKATFVGEFVKLFASILYGLLLGIIFKQFVKYYSKEILLMLFAIVLVFSEVAGYLNLDLLLVFIVVGFVIKNYSGDYGLINESINKLTFIAYLIFFTYTGIVIDVSAVVAYWHIALILLCARFISFYFSYRISTGIHDSKYWYKPKGWAGYLTSSTLLIPLVIVLKSKFPQVGNEIGDILIILILFDFLFGQIIYKFILENLFLAKNDPSNKEMPSQFVDENKKYKNSKFNEPQFQNGKLNKSLFNILFKLNDIVENFDKNFIHQRSEESIELVISATESYTDDYIKLKSVLSKQNIKPEEIYAAILMAKEQLSLFYIDLITERKKIEKNILKLEPLIKELFISLVDLTDSLQKKFIVDLESNYTISSKDDSFRIKIFKFKNRLVKSVNSYFNRDYKLVRVIDYRNLAKYYLIGQSASEILETVNLVGAERLNTLRQIRRLFQDYSNYLDELLVLSHQEKGNKELAQVILAKMEKIHSLFVNEIKVYNQEISNTTEELSTRLLYSLATPFNKFLEAISSAGTYDSKESKLKFSKIYSQSEAAKDIAMETVRYWMNYYIGFLGLFKKDAIISSLKVQLSKIVQENLLNVLLDINSNLSLAFTEISLILEKFGHEIEENISSNENISELIEHKKSELILPVINKYISNLDEIRKSRKLKYFAEIIVHEFSQLADELPDYINLLEDSDFKFKDRRPIFAGLRKAVVKEIAANYLEQKLPREISEINELILNHLNVSLDELKNLFAIVSYHSQNIIQSELENKENKEIIIELAYSLVDKIDHRINQLNQQIDRLEVNINKKVLERVNTSADTIEKLLIESSITKSTLQLETKAGKEKFIYLNKKLIDNLKIYAGKTLLVLRKVYNLFIKDRLRQILIGLDIGVDTTDSEPDTLILNEEKLKGLPFIYRKLFDGSPLESNDFFVQNEILSKKINTLLQNYKENKNSACLIIGEPGSGKKTLINSVKNSYLINQNIIHIQLTESVTSKSQLIILLSKELGLKRIPKYEELLITLNDKSNKRIIIIETLGKMYFKGVDGYEAIKNLLYLVSSTCNNIFWICSVGKLPYQFLNSNFEFARIFAEKIFINELHKTELKTILLSRHSATGYDLKYQPDDYSAFKNKIISRKNFLNDQKMLEENYFAKLAEYSEGNIISAMFYWLQSIQSVEENTIIIKPPRKISLEYFKGLSDLYMLTLAQLLYHGSISDVEHQKLFGLNLEESKEILNYLKSLNLIYKDSIDFMNNRYFINKFAYKIIEDELTRRNMI